ncbi:4'-phosphopantetheinyl transferase family protein [Balneola sp. MJW-20]|uniref:4'-phosphopantetheinyl transferase family protein n=1 Tax=Gracilimonas aurantiaca TaxID=3234185 RepID=UPI0034674714
MQIIPTSHFEGLPEDMLLACSPIRSDLSTSVLSAPEKTEYVQFRKQSRKDEFLTSRKLLNDMIIHLGLDHKSIILEKEEGGKPFLLIEDVRAFISFSHSKNMVWCAVSQESDIGLDVEPADRRISSGMLKRILHAKETGIEEEMDTIQIWTIKEAAVKKLGTGLRMNLNLVEIVRDHNELIEIKINDDYCFQICSFKQLDHQISIAY